VYAIAVASQVQLDEIDEAASIFRDSAQQSGFKSEHVWRLACGIWMPSACIRSGVMITLRTVKVLIPLFGYECRNIGQVL
jgi:hypothetical protein